MKLTFVFPNDESRHAFIAWYMDAGGESSFLDFCEAQGSPQLYSKPPPGRDDWEWNGRAKPLRQYTIAMVEGES